MLTVTEIDAPAAWASYLINGDSSGLDDAEIAVCKEWLESLENNDFHGTCVGASHYTVIRPFNGLLTELLTYEFISG